MIFICLTIVVFPDSPEPGRGCKVEDRGIATDRRTEKENFTFSLVFPMVLLDLPVNGI